MKILNTLMIAASISAGAHSAEATYQLDPNDTYPSVETEHAATAGAVDPLQAFVDETRTSYRAMTPTAGAPDAVAEVRSLFIPAQSPARNIPVRVYVPQGMAGEKNLPVVLFAHGGGFVSGDLDTHDVLVRAIANGAKALVVSIDYRLAPEFPFPAGLEDIYATLQWVAKQAAVIGGDANRIAVSGDSAGANLATAVAILSRDRSGPKIAAQWLMYPTVSNKMDTASWKEFGDKNFPTRTVNTNVIAAYVPRDTSPYAPLVAPLWAKHHNLPPALIQVGEYDPLRDENIAYADSLKKAGTVASTIVYKKQMHGFIQFYKDKVRYAEGETALNAGVGFLRSIFGGK